VASIADAIVDSLRPGRRESIAATLSSLGATFARTGAATSKIPVASAHRRRHGRWPKPRLELSRKTRHVREKVTAR
jgi:hypothetical protein